MKQATDSELRELKDLIIASNTATQRQILDLATATQKQISDLNSRMDERFAKLEQRVETGFADVKEVAISFCQIFIFRSNSQGIGENAKGGISLKLTPPFLNANI